MHLELPNDAILDTVRMRDVLAGLTDWKGKTARMLGTFLGSVSGVSPRSCTKYA